MVRKAILKPRSKGLKLGFKLFGRLRDNGCDISDIWTTIISEKGVCNSFLNQSQMVDNRWVVQVSEEDLLCKAGCGFYGNPQWKNYCSKCWRLHLKRSRGKSENAAESLQDFSMQSLESQIDRQSISPISSKTWPGLAWDRLFDPMWNTLSSPKASSLRSILKRSPSIELAQTTGQNVQPVGSVIPRRSIERQLSEESLHARNEFVQFLETLPKPIAQLVGKQVNLMTTNILRDSINVPLDDVSEAIQDIYNSMSNRLSTPLKDALSLVDEILEQVETYVCCRCYNNLFWSDSDEEVADISFQERVRSLHWVTCGPLDPGFDLANVAVVECFEKAISEIIATNSHRSPKQKLASLTSCCNLIFQCHKESRGTLASADEFLPALIYVVLKANPPLILSNVKFISRFALPCRLMSGEAGYYFTNLCCALNFIQNLNAKSLKMNSDEFEAYSCGQLVPPLRDSSLHGRQAIEAIENSLKALKLLHEEACTLLQKANGLKEMVESAAMECHKEIELADELMMDNAGKERANLPSPLEPQLVNRPFEEENNDTFNE
uniref:Rab5 GDP/GTP exchange factor n=1 Tax=Trichuris muris TaxID=70415 RepID=A0A5S6Q099_TRIMR